MMPKSCELTSIELVSLAFQTRHPQNKCSLISPAFVLSYYCVRNIKVNLPGKPVDVK